MVAIVVSRRWVGYGWRPGPLSDCNTVVEEMAESEEIDQRICWGSTAVSNIPGVTRQ